MTKQERQKEIRDNVLMVSICLASMAFGFFVKTPIDKAYINGIGAKSEIVITNEIPIEGVVSEEWIEKEAYGPQPEIVEEQKEEVYEAAYEVDDYTFYYFAKVIYAEMGDNEEGLYCAGSVILNRVSDTSGLYPNDIVSVINQTLNGVHMYPTYNTKKVPTELALEVAEDLLDNGSILPPYVLFEHYKHPMEGTKNYIRVDKDYFSYYEADYQKWLSKEGKE